MTCFNKASIIIVLGTLFIASPLAAADDSQADAAGAQVVEPGVAEVAAKGLQPLDWAILVAYAVGTLILGWHFGRKQESTKEYFIGSGNMNWMLIGVSLFATLLSTITYLSMPGEILGKGPIYLVQLLGLPFVFVLVGYWILPVYMRQQVTSAYELLETKLGLSIRLLGAVMFLLMRLVWMSLLVYLAAKALVVMMGVSDEKSKEYWIPIIVTITGLVSVIYTSLGGLRAVVITDLLQTILLFGGALLIVAMVTVDFGGFGWFPTTWHDGWDSQPILPINPDTGYFDPQIRITVVGTLMSVVIWYICTAGSDQVSVQRSMSTVDARAARRALGTQLTVGCLVSITLALVGLAMLGYFQAHAEQLPAHLSLKDNADEIFPYFIAHHLPVGISGLVVAAMFAAAMSSIDSGVNSVTAVVMTDFLKRFNRHPKTERKELLFARALALGIGIAVVVGSSFIGQVPGNITGVTNKVVNLFVTPMFSLFIFALFIPFSRTIGVWAGFICGTAIAVFIAFSGPFMIENFDPEFDQDPISFQWIAPVALYVNLCVGTLVSIAANVVMPLKNEPTTTTDNP